MKPQHMMTRTLTTLAIVATLSGCHGAGTLTGQAVPNEPERMTPTAHELYGYTVNPFEPTVLVPMADYSAPPALPEPMPEPAPITVPEPTPEPEPITVPEPEPEPTPAPQPEPEPAPQPTSNSGTVPFDRSIRPRDTWADSYSIGDRCWIHSTFDHGAGSKTVDTPYGRRTVRTVAQLLGGGPGINRADALYNDVQCGNGPANDAWDEARNGTGCPGRVDMGAGRGCGITGPRWKFDE